jgi:succinate dehydrogenase / fumarate reductase cytochrome b subunit
MATAATAVVPAQPAKGFVFARLGSLFGVLPLGIWTFFHLWNNLSAFRGAPAWQEAVTQHPHPIAEALTFFMVFAPLLIHAAWGIARLASSRPNNQHYGYYGNLKYILQRLSAIGLLGFLMAHVWLAFIHPRFFTGGPEPFADIAAHMAHHPPTLLVYLAGTVGLAFHLGNGLTTWAWSWGLLRSQRAVNRFDKVALLTFVLLWAMSWTAIYALYQAGTSLPPPEL